MKSFVLAYALTILALQQPEGEGQASEAVRPTRSFDFRTKLAKVEFPVDWSDLATSCIPKPQPNLQDSNVEQPEASLSVVPDTTMNDREL